MTASVERYCVLSDRPVRLIPGDRCLAHGASTSPCTIGLRPPQCEHPRRSPNHPAPTCSECGREIPVTDQTGTDREGRCPGRTCRADPGEPCVTSTGRVRRESHHLRWLAQQPAVTKCDCASQGCLRCHWTTFRPVDTP